MIRNPFRSILAKTTVCWLLLSLISVSCHASNGTYDFTVSLEFDPTAEQLALIEKRFTEADALFYDATDGQQHFGTITIWKNATKKKQAHDNFDPDIIIQDTGGQAYSFPGGFGDEKPNRCSHLFMKHTAQYNGLDDEKIGAYSIVHELSHLFFTLFDEYEKGKDAQGKLIPSTCVATMNSPTLNFCLMDNYIKYGGGKKNSTIRQYYVKSNHQPGLRKKELDAQGNPVLDNDGKEKEIVIENEQQLYNHCSCWERIAKRKKIKLPVDLPSTDVQKDPNPDLKFIVKDGSIASNICVDGGNSTVAHLEPGDPTYIYVIPVDGLCGVFGNGSPGNPAARGTSGSGMPASLTSYDVLAALPFYPIDLIIAC